MVSVSGTSTLASSCTASVSFGCTTTAAASAAASASAGCFGSTSSSSASSSTTSPWPWMKTARQRIGDPIQPLDEFDDRPAVQELIILYRKEIDLCYDLLWKDPLFIRDLHDDLWVLRFLLSHCPEKYQRFLEGKSITSSSSPSSIHRERNIRTEAVKSAVDAAKSTLAYREEHGFDRIDLRDLDWQNPQQWGGGDDEYPPPVRSLQKLLIHCCKPNTMIPYISDIQRGVVFVMESAGRDQHKEWKIMDEKDTFQALALISEWNFQWLDYTTRTTGRLTKALRIGDGQGVQRKMLNLESKRREAKTASILQDLYPQSLGSFVIVNSPSWANFIFALMRPFIPKRALSKLSLSNPKKNPGDLKMLLKYCPKDDLPTRFGGNLTHWPPPSLITT